MFFRRCKGAQVLGYLFSLLLLLFLIFCFFSMPRWWQWLDQEQSASRVLLCAAMPVAVRAGAEEELLPGPLTTYALKLWAALDLDARDPVSILKLEMPLLARVDPEEEKAVPKDPAVVAPPVFPAERSQALPEALPDALAGASLQTRAGGLTTASLVIIYHTHTGETYTLTDGMDRLEGKRGGVVQAGAAVQEVLEKKYGVRVVHSDQIHDAQYAVSYRESEKTLRKLLAEHPEAKVVLDIHRDAGRPRKNSLVKINGQEVAPVLLVVGSDARLPFPTWQENKKFAEELATRLNKQYPGLCLGVRVKDGRYNQFLHPRAVLVEVGSASNSTEEAVASTRLFANVLGEMILEIIKRGD